MPNEDGNAGLAAGGGGGGGEAIVPAVNSLVYAGLTSFTPTAQDKAAFNTHIGSLDTRIEAGKNNGWTASGGLLDENRYAMQSLMVTNPARYAHIRLVELETVRSEVNSSYDSTLRKFVDAGFSIKDAEKRATESANQVKNIAMKAFESKFPTSNDSKLLEVQHNNQKYSTK